MQLMLPFMPQPRWWHGPLARLLAHANAWAPHAYQWADRETIYLIKDQILHRWGILDGIDYQEIKRYCRSCEGTGGLYEPGGCYRCGGTGIYRLDYYRLDRYRLGNQVFHRPTGRLDGPQDGAQVTIKGKIQHPPTRRGPAAYLWLLLLFEPRTFLYRVGRVDARPGWSPMLWLNYVAAVARLVFNPFRLWRWLQSLGPQRCLYCGQRKCQCVVEDEDGELPF